MGGLTEPNHKPQDTNCFFQNPKLAAPERDPDNLIGV
jgi:hypothetical protein